MVNESWSDPKYYFQINFFSKIDFIKNLYKQKKLKKYIYIGTPEIFGSNKTPINENAMLYNPTTPYASSKLALEMLLNNFIQKPVYKIIIARFSNFYGSGQPMHRLLPKLIYCINNHVKFPLQPESMHNMYRKIVTRETINFRAPTGCQVSTPPVM